MKIGYQVLISYQDKWNYEFPIVTMVLLISCEVEVGGKIYPDNNVSVSLLIVLSGGLKKIM